MIGLVGRKVGIDPYLNEDGVSVPVTVIEIEANRVTQVKTLEKRWLYCSSSYYWSKKRIV